MLQPVFVRRERCLVKIHPEEIVALRTVKNYTNIFLSENRSIAVRASLLQVLEVLPREIFLRVHRSHAVSVYYIDEVYRHYLKVGAGHLREDESTVPIGKDCYKDFMNRIKCIG